MLPDELVLMIIKRAVDLDDTGHTIILDVIPYISARFNRLAKDKSLWHGSVNINIGPAHYSVGQKERKLRMVIRNHLSAGVKSLSLKTDKHKPERKPFFRSEVGKPKPELPKPKLTAKDMIAMAVKCPNLKKLHLNWFELESLPALENPWNLENMSLDNIDINPGAFNDTEIHDILPKLGVFEMRDINREDLPDMRKCHEIHRVFRTNLGWRPEGSKEAKCAAIKYYPWGFQECDFYAKTLPSLFPSLSSQSLQQYNESLANMQQGFQ